MTDTEDDKPSSGKDKDKKRPPKAETLEGALVEPTPKRPDFTAWLEELFDGTTQFPEKIETYVIEGKKSDRLGKLVDQVQFAPGEKRPSKEKIVALSNKMVHKVQYDCDVQRRTVIYQIHAMHFSRETDYYTRFLIRCNPRPLGSGHEEPRENPDEDGVTTQERFSTQILGHQERMIGLLGAGYEGMLDRDDRTIERLLQRIKYLEETLERKNDQLERALSNELDREERRASIHLKNRVAEKAFEMGSNLIPPLLSGFLKKNGGGGVSDSFESMTLKEFFKTVKEGGRLTDEQADAAFGHYDDTPEHNLVRPGVLTEQQSTILFRVARAEISPDELDKLMPGGPCAITGEQGMALQKIFPLEHIAPLMLLFQGRQNRQQQQSAPPPQ